MSTRYFLTGSPDIYPGVKGYRGDNVICFEDPERLFKAREVNEEEYISTLSDPLKLISVKAVTDFKDRELKDVQASLCDKYGEIYLSFSTMGITDEVSIRNSFMSHKYISRLDVKTSISISKECFNSLSVVPPDMLRDELSRRWAMNYATVDQLLTGVGWTYDGGSLGGIESLDVKLDMINKSSVTISDEVDITDHNSVLNFIINNRYFRY